MQELLKGPRSYEYFYEEAQRDYPNGYEKSYPVVEKWPDMHEWPKEKFWDWYASFWVKFLNQG